MTHLGLETEADLLAKTSSIHWNSRRSRDRTSQQPRHEWIEQLIEKGLEVRAIKTSLRELTALADRHLTMLNLSLEFYQSRDIIDALRLNGLADNSPNPNARA